MRKTIRTLTGIGCVTAAVLLAAPAHGQSMSGGSGTFSGGGGSSSGGGGGGGGGSSGSSGGAQNVNSTITATQLQQSVGNTPSALNSFNNVGSGTTSNGIVSASNPLAAYYYNPLAQGYITVNGSGTPSPSNVPFGTALYANAMSGSSSSGSLGGRGAGNAFGGTSSSSRGSFGGTSASGLSGGLSGTATLRGGAGTTVTVPQFTGGGSYGPAIGRRGPVIGGSLAMVGMRPIPMTARRSNLQRLIALNSRIAAPGGIVVTTNGNAVVLSGRVASLDERRIAENVLRMSPGVYTVQNNLTVGPPPGPPALSPSPGSIPGPNPIAPPPGTGP